MEKNIYKIGKELFITSDEEIKEGDSVIIENVLLKNIKAIEIEMYQDAKKIIFTTDPDLIKDGVQAIDDEFLEQYVLNPVDFVEVKKDIKAFDSRGREIDFAMEKEDYTKTFFSVSFPPKKELKTEKHLYTKEESNMVDKLKEYLNNTPKEQVQKDWDESCKQVKGVISPTIEEFIEAQRRFNKQETTSEGFHRISKEIDYSEFDFVSFKIGIEWQQEQDKNMYSEEEVKKIAQEFHKKYAFTHATKWDWFFEKFKKK